MILNVCILIIAFILIVCVPFVAWIHSPSNRVASADEYFFDGDIDKAEKTLLKVWTRRDDVPARLAQLYFQLIKSGRMEYVQKAMSLPTEGLGDIALTKLEHVQAQISRYMEHCCAMTISGQYQE